MGDDTGVSDINNYLLYRDGGGHWGQRLSTWRIIKMYTHGDLTRRYVSIGGVRKNHRWCGRTHPRDGGGVSLLGGMHVLVSSDLRKEDK